jgi:hypothetical protein|tara:strand:- start:191 stop:430 length:240 start_codon:yes stop_codon:yes gene_type:complete
MSKEINICPITGMDLNRKTLDRRYNSNSDWLHQRTISDVTYAANNNIALHDDSDISYLYNDRFNELNQAYQETNEHLEL